MQLLSCPLQPTELLHQDLMYAYSDACIHAALSMLMMSY